MVTNQNIMPVEGTSGTFTVATFTDTNPGPPSAYSATIDWGDGTPTTTGTITETAGTFSVTGTHTYADETAAGSTLPVTVQIQESADGDSGTANSTASVAEGDVLTGTGSSLTATEGASFSGAVATFTDTFAGNSASDFTASIVWGDGTTTAGTVSGSAGSFTVNGTHTYAEDGSFPVQVTLTDDTAGSASGSTTSTMDVAEVDLAATGTTITPTEGQSFTGTVATFTDMGSPDASTVFSASIAWGDGVTDTGVITGSNGSFSVSGTHTYTDEGSFPVSVQITENGVTNGMASASTTANVAEGDVLTGTGTVLTVNESQSFSGSVATFTDSNTNSPAGDFTATIAWGDGTSTSGTVSGGNGSFSVSGTHTYTEDGSFPVSVTLAEKSPGTATGTAGSTADLAEADLSVTPGTAISVTERQTFSGAVATFTDTGSPDSATAFTASIDWGDGTTTTGSITSSAGTFTIQGTHIYSDEGSFTVSVLVVETAISNGTATASLPAQAAEGDTLTGTAMTFSPTETHSFSGAVASFTDTDTSAPAGDFTATIDWGDGTTTPGTVSGSGGSFTVSGTHTYADEGSFPVGVTLQDDAPGTAHVTANSTATVAEVDVLTATGVTLTESEGNTFAGPVATFTDTNTTTPAGAFTNSIVWGDGTTTTGTVTGSAGNFTVTGAHTYAEDGTLPVKVTVAEASPGTATATASSTANIGENDLTAPSATITATERQSFSGAVATFTDTGSPDSASAFTASIDWGDGTTSTGSVTGSAGSFTVNGTHTYADEGSFTIAVNITETGVTGGTVSAIIAARVSEADVISAPSVFGPISATQNQPFHGEVATYSTNNPDTAASDFVATIDWGDGSTSAGTLLNIEGHVFVFGSHTYAEAGSFPVSVTITDDGAGTASATGTTTATVTAAVPPAWLDRVYHDLLHRAVDPTGRAGWTGLLNQGFSRQFIVAAIEQSVEYRTDEVENLYQTLLNRAADPVGLNGWVNALGSGLTILDVEAGIVGSAEFFQKAGDETDPPGLVADEADAPPTNQDFVNALYADLLHRAPDPGGQSLTLNALANGVSRQAIAAAVLSSDEFHADLVNSLYAQFLQRAPDSFGFQLSTQALRNGFSEEGLIAVLLGSDEYFMSTTD